MTKHIDDDLLDESLKKAMELRRLKRAILRRLDAMATTYEKRTAPLLVDVAELDAQVAELIQSPAPTATEPAAEAGE